MSCSEPKAGSAGSHLCRDTRHPQGTHCRDCPFCAAGSQSSRAQNSPGAASSSDPPTHTGTVISAQSPRETTPAFPGSTGSLLPHKSFLQPRILLLQLLDLVTGCRSIRACSGREASFSPTDTPGVSSCSSAGLSAKPGKRAAQPQRAVPGWDCCPQHRDSTEVRPLALNPPIPPSPGGRQRGHRCPP